MDKSKLKEYSDILQNYHNEIAEFYNDYAKSVGLTVASLAVLYRIYNDEKCTQATIIKNTFLPKQTVCAIIKSFQEKGLIYPLVESETDKRHKFIQFTESGFNYAKEIISKSKENEYRAIEALGEDKFNVLIDLVKLFIKNLKMI